jgi:hypothetical protein
MYNADNPGIILEHQSATPWGPWTGGHNIFNWEGAIGHYIHEADRPDGLSDPGDEHKGGAVYGPYIF